MRHSPCQNRMIPTLFQRVALLESVLRSAGNRASASSNRPCFTSSFARVNRSRASGIVFSLVQWVIRVKIHMRLKDIVCVRCERVTAGMGKCPVCELEKATSIDRQADVNLCEHCPGRGAREQAHA